MGFRERKSKIFIGVCKLRSMARYVVIDDRKDIYALVSKEVMAGYIVIKFQIETNIKIIKADNAEICYSLYSSIGESFAKHYYESNNAANVYSPRDALGIQIISYFLN